MLLIASEAAFRDFIEPALNERADARRMLS
jgi:hypothetical protein